MTSLQALAERLEKATGPDREIDVILFGLLGDDAAPWSERDIAYALTSPETTCAAPRYSAALDAAIALCERALPGWDICVARISNVWEASIGPTDTLQAYSAKFARHVALALVLAVVRAKLAEEAE